MTPQRRDSLAILAFTGFGAGLRFARVSGAGLDHFDEGIYAMVGTWSSSPSGLGSLDPGVIAYAPPVFPILVGLAYAVFGISDTSAIVVSTIAGTASIPVVGWIARRIYGPGAGASASGLAAASSAHITFSTMALTDATFLLAWLVAIAAGIHWLDRPKIGRALALGIAVGLAQGVKYNGWLAGAIIALAAGSLLWGRARPKFGWTVGTLAVAALTAIAVGLPWLGFVERHGGYRALLTHQRSYLGGFDQWWPHLKIQIAQLVALSGGESTRAWSALGSVVGCLAVLGFRPRSAWLLIPAIVAVARPELVWWLGLTMLPTSLRHPDPSRRLAGLAWLILSLLTPFYHPYARLWLPLHAAGWISLAGAFNGLAVVKPATSRLGIDGVWVEIFAAILLAFSVRFAMAPPPVGIELRPGAGRTLRDGLNSQSAIAQATGLRVLARPPMLFYLGMRGVVFERASGVADMVGSPPNAWLLVDGAMLRQEGNAQESWRKLAEGRVVAADWETVLGPATWLDVDPGAATGQSNSRIVRFTLFRPRRPGEVADAELPR